MKKMFLGLLMAFVLVGCQAGHNEKLDHDDHRGQADEHHHEHHEDDELQAVDHDEKLQVMASFYPLAYLMERVGGEQIEVTNVTPVGGEPHDYEPSSRELASIVDADLLVYMGQNLEPWAEDVVAQYGDLNAIEMSSKVTLMKHEEEEDHDEHGDEDEHHDEDHDEHEDHEDEDEHHEQEEEEGHHHDHGEFDPHVWLDPLLMEDIAEEARDALVELDPQDAGVYQASTAAFVDQLKQLDAEYQQGLNNCALDTAIVSHNAFSYLGSRYGITFASISGLSPQSEPSARHLAELSELAKEKGIGYIFFETLVSDKLAKTIADEVGAEILVLNPLEGLTPAQDQAGADYLSIMKENLTNLQTALQCQ